MILETQLSNVQIMLYENHVNQNITPEENQSPSGVGFMSDLMESAIETAVDAAEDLPHFWISAPPRCCP